MLPRSLLSALFLDCIWNACNNNASFPFMTRLMTLPCASVKLSSRCPPPRAIVPIAGSSRNLVKPELRSPVVFLSPEAYHAISSSSPKRRSSGRPGVPFLLGTMQAGVRQLTFAASRRKTIGCPPPWRWLRPCTSCTDNGKGLLTLELANREKVVEFA